MYGGRSRRRSKAARRRTVASRRRRGIGKAIPRLPKKLTGYYRQGGSYGRYGSGMELKFLDKDSDSTTISASGEVTTSLNIIAQGTTESERIGRNIFIRKIQLNILMDLAAAADQADIPNGDILRIMLFVDTQTNGANAAVLDLLETATFNSYRNLANSHRFVVLMDQCWPMNRIVAGTDGASTVSTPLITKNLIKKFFSVNIPIEFDSTAGAITEMRSNNVAMLYITRNALVNVQVHSRVRFNG